MLENKTFFGRLIAAIISVFVMNWEDFAKKTYPKIPDDLKKAMEIGITLVEKIKQWVDGDVADFIIAAIPGNWDDELRDKASDILQDILLKYNAITAVDKTFVTPPLDALKVAAEINHALTGIPEGQAVVTTQIVFEHMRSEERI